MTTATIPRTAVVADLPRPGEVVIRHGEPYVFCDPCKGTGEATQEGDPFCVNCFGTGVAPVLDAARFRFQQATTPVQPVVQRPERAAAPTTFAGAPTQSIKMCSDSQLRFIMDLARSTGTTHTEGGKLIADLTTSTPGFTSRRASEVIDFLKGLPKVQVSRVMRNRREQGCQICGQMVPAGEGILTHEEIVIGVSGGQAVSRTKWNVTHDGECPEPPASITQRYNELLADLPDAYFAIPFVGDDAHTDLTFVGIRTRDSGDRFLVHVVGGHGEYCKFSFEWAEKVVAALRSTDLNEAAALYGREIGHCGRCGKSLTTESSRAMGIGPTCAGKADF